jgi:cell division protein FtsL
MFAKLLVIVLAIGLIAAALLMIRQQRLDAVHEMAQIHRRVNEQQTSLWLMRTRIADRCRPDRIREAAQELGVEWRPIPTKPDAAHLSGAELVSETRTDIVDAPLAE